MKSKVMPEARLELAWPCGRQILSLVRLPIPPPGPNEARNLAHCPLLAHLLESAPYLLLERHEFRALDRRHHRREVALLGFHDLNASLLNVDELLQAAIHLRRVRRALVAHHVAQRR